MYAKAITLCVGSVSTELDPSVQRRENTTMNFMKNCSIHNIFAKSCSSIISCHVNMPVGRY